MNNVKALIEKDFYEYRNNFKKSFITIVIVIAGPIVLLNFMGVASYILKDTKVLVNVVVILFTSLSFTETTLFQVHRDVKNGVYEKYFINLSLKKYQIVVSKLLTNIIIVISLMIIIWGINYVFGKFALNHIPFTLDIKIIITLLMTCGIGTGLGFINSLIITDEKNATTFGISMMACYFGYFKVLELLKISDFIFQTIGLFVISIIFIYIIVNLLRKNKFITRE